MAELTTDEVDSEVLSHMERTSLAGWEKRQGVTGFPLPTIANLGMDLVEFHGYKLLFFVVRPADLNRREIRVLCTEAIDPLTSDIYRWLIRDGAPYTVERSRPEDVVYLHDSPQKATNTVSPHLRYYRRCLSDGVRFVPISHEEMMTHGTVLYGDNRVRFDAYSPEYSHLCSQTIEDDSESRYYEQARYKHFGMFLGDECLAVVTGTPSTSSQFFWSRTLRSFNQDHEKYRVGHSALFYLLDWSYASGFTSVNLGQAMDYKKEVWTPHRDGGPWSFQRDYELNLFPEAPWP